MNSLKQTMLGAYYLATLPVRKHAESVHARAHTAPVRIMFYHRVADEHINDWTISTRMFARQIRWLRRRFDIVTLAEGQRRIASGQNDRPTACITFDDGYADNLRFALPLLAKYALPYTYFVATEFIESGRPFPHDVAAGQPLIPNSPNQLRRLAAAGAEVAAHTRNHINLGDCLTAEQLNDEIRGCKCELEAMTKRPVRYFAFPYGQKENLSADAFRIAHEAGYDGVCSAYGGYNFPGDDAFHLRRFHADREIVRFKNWLTVDPRKLRAQHDFDPGQYRIADCGLRINFFQSAIRNDTLIHS
jgi:peptidoglycan/xylan/chitin deacetylase (PgdA/CDA1 family)